MATAETRKAKSRLNTLASSLDELESAIEPLFSGGQTLPEILLALDPIQQAKLQTVLPYLVYDLIFIYLKSRGIDPKTHAVVAELDRVRQYFEKIKNAENPPVRTNQVDKGAASRFIKHAISQTQRDADAAGGIVAKKTTTEVASTAVVADTADSGPSSSTRVPAKVTSKMTERAEWERRVREAGNEEEDGDLDGWEDADTSGEFKKKKGEERVKIDKKGKGKAKDQDELIERVGSKRRRQAMDPFAASGYGEESESSSESQPTKKQALTPDATSHPEPTSASVSTTPTRPTRNLARSGKRSSVTPPESNTDKDAVMENSASVPVSDSNSPGPTPDPAVQSTKTEKKSAKKAKQKKKETVSV